MTRKVAASVALALAGFAPVAFADGNPAPSANNGADLRSHHAYASLRSPRGERSCGRLGARSVPHRVYEREGLTRNPEDCVVWGCIGNN